MSDTPPYYWLNGEDGPLEQESRPPPDGVLAARPMSGQTGTSSKKGALVGLDLSRSADRKRHGYEGEAAPIVAAESSIMPGCGLRPPMGLQVPGLATPAPQQFGGVPVLPRCNSIPGPPMSPFASYRQGAPQLSHGPHTQFYPAPSALSPNIGPGWPANCATTGQQGPMFAQQEVQGQAQVPTPNLVRASSNVQRIPMSPSLATRMQTPPASPGAWTRNVGSATPQAGLQNSSSFHRPMALQKTNSFTSGNSATRSSSFTAAPPDGMVGIGPSTLPSNQMFASAPGASPMGNGGPMMYPPSPPSTHGSYVAVPPAPRPPLVRPPGCMRMSPPASAYTNGLAQGPQGFSPASQFAGPVDGTWSAPVPGLAIPRPMTPSMESRSPLGNASAGNIRRMREAHQTSQANSYHPIDIHHEFMMQGATSRPATSSVVRQRHQRTSPAHQKTPQAQERVRLRRHKMHEQTTQRTASPATNPWMEGRSTSQSPTLSSYSFGQTMPVASEPPDFRSSSLAPGQSEEAHMHGPARAGLGGIEVQDPPRTHQPAQVERTNHQLRILVTGSTGLLGRQVLHALNGFHLRGLCRSRGRGAQLVSCDLTAEGEATRQIVDFSPHIVIHLAGERRSDVIRRSPSRSRLINIDSSGAIAAACEFCGAWLIFVSTDAVFDGRSPPYAEDDSPTPISEYGWHKLHAEKVVLAACPRSAVLRLPLLYGPVEFAAESLVTEIYSELRVGMKELDHHQRFYPAWTCDVAKVIRAMIEVHVSGKEVRGIFHLQGSEQFTKYDIGMIIASACGFPAPRPQPRDPIAGSDVPPQDARLDCSRLQGLLSSCGFNIAFTPLREGLKHCLELFQDARMDIPKPSRREETTPPHAFATNSREALREVIVEPSQHRPPTYEGPREPQSDSAAKNQVSPPILDTRHGGIFAPLERVNTAESNIVRDYSETLAQIEKKQTDRLQTLSLRNENGQVARAAALKNVFREELEMAWRRYRDAANHDNVDEASNKMFGNGEQRGVLV